jgi:hypothetical protein
VLRRHTKKSCVIHANRHKSFSPRRVRGCYKTGCTFPSKTPAQSPKAKKFLENKFMNDKVGFSLLILDNNTNVLLELNDSRYANKVKKIGLKEMFYDN